jgi:hypothetical protein
VAVLVAAGLITWLVWPSQTTALTYQGTTIAAPGTVLQSAESTVKKLVADRHGAMNEQSRCYFSKPTKRPSGAKKTDVDDHLTCGPVLFVDGDPANAYLAVPFRSENAGGKAQLTPTDSLADVEPAAVPDSVTLVRPDGKSTPSGTGGLSVPKPPAADKDVLTAAQLGETSPPPALEGATMIGRSSGVTVLAAGSIDRYGSGDDARSAPAGEQLIAFKVRTESGDVDKNGSATVSVAVAGSAPRPLPRISGPDDYVVVAAPTSAAVSLQLADGGFTQELSLPDGKPGAGNIAVLARKHRTATIGKKVDVPVHLRGAGGSADVTFHASAAIASLDFWVPNHTDRHPASAANAMLSVDLDYTDPHSPGHTYGFDPQLLKLRLPDGKLVAAHNIAAAGKIFNVFEVPADFTSGTLQVAGSETVGSVTLTITHAVGFAIAIPAG